MLDNFDPSMVADEEGFESELFIIIYNRITKKQY